jgi:hypothetical protein
MLTYEMTTGACRDLKDIKASPSFFYICLAGLFYLAKSFQLL